MAITNVASRSKSAWRIPSSARQQRVSHDGSSARYRSHAATNEKSHQLAGARVRRAVARGESAKHRAANRFRLLYSSTPTPTASRKSSKTIKSTRLTIRRRTRRIQSKKSPVEKGRFRLAESDCIRNGLKSPIVFGRFFFLLTSQRDYYQVVIIRLLLSRYYYQVIIIRLLLSGYYYQVFIIRLLLSGFYYQVIIIRLLLSGYYCQVIIVRLF